MAVKSDVGESLEALVFALGKQKFGLPLAAVDRVIRAVAIHPPTHTQPGVAGTIGVQGETLVVCDLRGQFPIPARALSAADSFVLLKTGDRRGALIVEEIVGIRTLPRRDSINVAPSSVKKLEQDIILLDDVSNILPLNPESERGSVATE